LPCNAPPKAIKTAKVGISAASAHTAHKMPPRSESAPILPRIPPIPPFPGPARAAAALPYIHASIFIEPKMS
jgi:hypothetical protein